MRILIAGGTGVLGRRIVTRLLAAGQDVVVMTRSAERAGPLRSAGAEVVEGDALDAAATARAVSDAGPDLVMHQLTDLSAADPAANARLRVIGSRNLVEAALAAGVDRMVAQSIAWCYEPGDHPAEESVALDAAASSEPRRTTVQAVATLETEAARVPHHVILRNGMLYGPDTWYSPSGATAAAATAQTLPATGDVISFVHVDDAAAAACQAVDWASGTFNIVDDEPAAGHDWVPVFCRAVGAPPPLPGDDARQPWARGATNAAALGLGWDPRWRSWREGFEAMQRSA